MVPLAMVGTLGLQSLQLSSSTLFDTHRGSAHYIGLLFPLHLSPIHSLSNRSLSGYIPFLDVKLAFHHLGGDGTYGYRIRPIHLADVQSEEAKVR